MAAKLQCEICGGKLVGKPGGIFECDSCGMEYDTAWAKAKIQEIRGTVKVEGTVEVQGTVKVEGAANMESLMKRGNMALEDGKWAEADTFFERVLDADPENGEAWLGKLLAELHIQSVETMKSMRLDASLFNPVGTVNLSSLNYETAIRERNSDLSTVLGQIARLNGVGYKDFFLALKGKSQRVRATREQVEELSKHHAFFDVLPDFGIPMTADKVFGTANYQKFSHFAPKELVQQVEHCIRQSENKEKEKEAEAASVMAEEKKQQSIQLAQMRERIEPFTKLISAGEYHTVAVTADGTVLAAGSNENGQCKVSKWTDIIAISAGGFHTVGLRADGTVVAAGSNSSGQCKVGKWTGIVAVAAGDSHTVGLRADGTVVATGDNEDGQCSVSEWRDIVAVFAGGFYSAGIKSDGTVLTAGDNTCGQPDTKNWRNIVSIAAGENNMMGLSSDGTVQSAGRSSRYLKSSEGPYISIAYGSDHAVGLRPDGTVVAVGSNITGQCDVSDWNNIVAIAAGTHHTVALRSDGTVLSTVFETDNAMYRMSNHGQCKVKGWKLFRSADTLKAEQEEGRERIAQERQEAAERAERKRKEEAERVEQHRRERIASLTTEQASLNTELANLKGLFSGKRRKEIEERLAEIEAELKKLNG